MANRRYQGEDASEQIEQSSVHAGDMFQVRTQIGTIYDADKGMSFAELKGGFVATCTTAGATVAKVASIANYPDFQLKNGMEVLCYFTNANAATSPTFNLAGTGAYPLALENQASGVNIGEGCWGAGVFLHLRYVDLTVSGTRIQKWIILGHNVASQNTSSSSGYTIYSDGRTVYGDIYEYNSELLFTNYSTTVITETYTPTEDCTITCFVGGGGGSVEKYARCLYNGIVICSAITTTTGVGNSVRLNKGKTYTFNLKGDGNVYANVYKGKILNKSSTH